jgi:hypothetical protein
MANGYTVFFSYLLVPTTGYTNGGGYSEAIHCNYINRIYLESIVNKEVNINFTNFSDFKFLSAVGGTGFTANQIFVLVQLIDNASYTNLSDVKPIAADWKMWDVTDQVSGYTTGNTFALTQANITSTIYSVPIYKYGSLPSYNLNYLNYPNHLTSDDDKLCFGDEEYFFGNVCSDIEAIAYTTDLAINLPLNQFNSTSNATWDGVSQVFITEIGLYDGNKNLIAIAKLNDPIPKDGTIARTMVFGLDF